MARDLRTRLAGIRSTSTFRPIPGNVEVTPELDGSVSAPDSAIGFRNDPETFKRTLPGWEKISPHFWMRELNQHVAPVDLALQLDGSPFSGRLKDARLHLAGMRFFDLETTGLSGGTGTVAFLATLGRYSASDRFSTMQYFMDDYPGEPSMVNRLAADLSEAASVVTYNGSSFDLPLFRTRCIMNGLHPSSPVCHVDLLPPARRLWRGVLPDCSLGTIEREILSIDRGPDLPGSAIPERWFSYLRHGDLKRHALEIVFSHNDHDVRTLAQLLVMMAEGFEAGQMTRADPVGLAVLIGRSNPDLALNTLEMALADGELRAIKPLMRTYWKAGRHEDRMGLVPRLPDDGYGLYMKSVRAEKVDKDLETAMVLARQAMALAVGGMAKRVEQRLKRLSCLQAGNRSGG